MKCLSCKNGTPTEGTTTFTAERDGVFVIVKHVPARICNICGEEYFDAAITARVLKNTTISISVPQGRLGPEHVLTNR